MTDKAKHKQRGAMTRAIKFRAWDGDKMLEQISLYWNGVEFISGVWNFEETHIVEGETKPEIMQYTGLKDCNGVEIAEGDILETTHPIMPDPRPRRLEIKWNDAGFNIRAELLTSFPMKVIGNIHEHSELLND